MAGKFWRQKKILKHAKEKPAYQKKMAENFGAKKITEA
jgi:hypothetical protein